MKKLVAVLLGLSMILSAGCNKDKDGGKTGSDADAKDPSETDPDATDTSAVPAAAPVEVECKNDLERIPYDEDYTFGGTFYPKEITEDDWESDPEGDYRWIKVDLTVYWNQCYLKERVFH